MAKVDVILPALNEPELTCGALEWLIRSIVTGNLRVIHVDDGSDPESRTAVIDKVRDLGADVEVVHSSATAGFHGAVQKGMARATAEYVLILHNDCEVVPGCVERLASALDSTPSYGAVGPRLVRDRQLCVADAFPPESGPCEVVALPMSCIMIRRSLVADGAFDFSRLDDMRAQGHLIGLAPHAVAYHPSGAGSPIATPKPATPKREYVPVVRDAAPMHIEKLAVVAVHFNPAEYRKPVQNFYRFLDGMRKQHVDLWTVELAYDDSPFRLPNEGSQAIQLRGTRERNNLWQKERLINIAIDAIPDDVDAVAWVDADLLFADPDWQQAAMKKLEIREVIQLWDEAYDVLANGELQQIQHTACGARFEDGDDDGVNFRVSHPGFAWAARMGWLRKYGLCDTHITGGGDTLMLRAFTGLPTYHERVMNPKWMDAHLAWVRPVQQTINRSFGAIPGVIHHFPHGKFENRKYVERWHYQGNHGYDPVTDIEKEPNGIWRWTDQAMDTKPKMVQLVSDYFDGRLEDD